MKKYEIDPELDRRDRSRRMKSPTDRRMRRESPPIISNRGPPIPRDPYEDYPPRPKERETHAYKILCVANLNHKVSDNTIRDSLHREFARFGEVSVKVCHDGNERFAYIYFRTYEEAREARHAKSRLILFEKILEIEPIYEKTMPSTSRRRSLTPDYGPLPNQRNMRGQQMNNSPPPPQHQSRRPPPPPPHQNTQMMKHHNNNSYQRNYNNNNSMNNHHQQQDHYNPYNNSGHMNQRANHHNNLHNNNHVMRNDFHNNHHHSNNNHNNNHQGTNQNHHMRPQQRESKKDKFPNYLHHIPPEDDDKATRTLFVGNLEVTISDQNLKRIFEKYGSVEDIDVKRPPPGQGNAYAFIKFLNLDMAHRCKVEMSGQYIGKFQCKIGYGKCTPTTRIWLGGLGSWTSLSHLEHEFDRFGAIRKIDFVKGDNHAYIQYDSIDAAQAACQEMRGFPLGGPDKRLRVDFADPEPYNYSIPTGRISESNYNADSVSLEASNPPKNGNGESSYSQRFNSRSEFQSENFNNTNEDWPEENEDIKRSELGSNSRDMWTGDGPQPTSPGSRVPVKRQRTSDASSDLSIAKKNRQTSVDDSEGDGGNFDSRNNIVISENVSTISELIKCCPVAWNGGLILKSMIFPARMLSCSGDISLVDLLMKDNSSEMPVLRITQRLRLDPVRLEDVSRRVASSGPYGHCMMLTVAGSSSMQFSSGQGEDGGATQTRPLRNLVSYLKQKEAAGVVSLNSTKEGKDVLGVLYVFPPCTYATDLLKKVAPNLVTDSSKETKEEYLIIVVVKG